MKTSTRRLLALVLACCAGLVALGTVATAAPTRGEASTTFRGAFEFEGMAAVPAGKGCRGEGAFGVMKPRARVRLSERVASGEFETLGRGKLGRGTTTAVDGDDICRMPFVVKTKTAPASDSRIYLEVKGVTFDISWPAADVADGDLGTWRCEHSDNTCAEVVGGA